MITMLFQMLKFALAPIANLLFRILGLGYKSKKSVIISSVFLFIVIVPLQFAQIYHLGYDTYKMYATFYLMIANVVAMLIVTNDGLCKSLFLLMLQANATFTLTIIVNAIRHCFDLDYIELTAILAVLLFVLLYVAIKYWAKPLRFLVEQIKSRWIIMLIIPVVVLISGILITTYSDTYFGTSPLFYLAIVCLIEGAFFLYIVNLYHNLRTIYNYSNQTKQQEVLKNEIEAYNKEVTIMKTVRHDARHHSRVLAELLQNNDVEGALKYLQSYEKAIDSTKSVMYCKNLIANAVFRLYDKKYGSINTTFSVVADIPEDLPLESNDLCVLLSNILENAFESCQNVERVDRFVTVNAVRNDNDFQLEISNSTAESSPISAEHLPQSTKVAGGTGLISIKLIVEKANGIIRLNRADGVFTTQIIIPLS